MKSLLRSSTEIGPIYKKFSELFFYLEGLMDRDCLRCQRVNGSAIFIVIFRNILGRSND